MNNYWKGKKGFQLVCSFTCQPLGHMARVPRLLRTLLPEETAQAIRKLCDQRLKLGVQWSTPLWVLQAGEVIENWDVKIIDHLKTKSIYIFNSTDAIQKLCNAFIDDFEPHFSFVMPCNTCSDPPNKYVTPATAVFSCLAVNLQARVRILASAVDVWLTQLCCSASLMGRAINKWIFGETWGRKIVVTCIPG